MRHTHVLALALALLLWCCAPIPGARACELCVEPGEMLCGCDELHGLMDEYVEGFGDGDHDDSLAAFRLQGGGWTFTSGGVANPSQPTRITWSIVPNGTPMPSGLGEPATPSNLITFLDNIHHGGPGPGGTDLTQRAWFPLFNASFERWDELSGLTITYEPRDDGLLLGGASGLLGRRGDHRIGGHSIDGQVSPTFLAYNYFPNNSDMVIDTDEVNRWGNPDGNYLRFRNMLMHEFGHGLGLQHVASSDAQFLMEAFLAIDFDGPQLDDILGVHRLYGDVNESAPGNDTYFNSTLLGTLTNGQELKVGTDAHDTAVAFTDVDFVSIDAVTDIDYFRFTVPAPARFDIHLTPLGPTYMEGPQGGAQTPFNTAANSNLSLTLWDTSGTSILDSADAGGLGDPEVLERVTLLTPGVYYVSVRGLENLAQFYELGITNVTVPEPGALWLATLACLALAKRRR